MNPVLAYRPPPNTGLAIMHVDDLLIVDKPAGRLSVPGRGPEGHDNLATRVQQRYLGALIVHRLDMGTSGLTAVMSLAGLEAVAKFGCFRLSTTTGRQWSNLSRKVSFGNK